MPPTPHKLGSGASRARSLLAAAGGRVAGAARGAAHHLRPPITAPSFRLLSQLPDKLPRLTVSPEKKVGEIVGVKQLQESAPTPTTTRRPEEHEIRAESGPRLVWRGRRALRAAARVVRKPPRAALRAVRRAVAGGTKWPSTPATPTPSSRPAHHLRAGSRQKIVTTDRDIMKKELKKVQRERDEALNRLHQDQPANYGGTMSKGGMNDKSLDYESLKMQRDKAMAEVQGLLKQNVEITRKYDNAMKDVDYYRKQERAAYTALQNLRMQYEEVVAEKQKLEREVTSLQTIMEDDRKEIADLRRQQQVSNLLVRAFSIVDGASQN